MSIKKSGEFTVELLGDRAMVIKYLEALREGFADSRIILGSKKTQLVFEPNELINLKIKGSCQNGENKISVKIYWRNNKNKENK